MSRQIAWGALAALVVQGAIGSPSALAQPPPPPLPEAPAAPLPRVLAFGGGISEGSYESGLNWATVRLLKNRTRRGKGGPLVGVAGASAGGINALLTAIEWCQSDTADRTETATSRNNLLYQTWNSVDWHDLYEGKRTTTDGVLARSAFVKPIAAVRDALVDVVRFPAGMAACEIRVGMTLTRSNPGMLSLPEGRGALNVPTQRFDVVLDAKKQLNASGLAIFDQAGDCDDATLGASLHVVSDTTTGRVAIDDVIGLLEATSAFPVAFGTKILNYCADLRQGHGCRVPASAEFWDGGLFDNEPLGLAITMVRRRNAHCAIPNPSPAYQFMMFDLDKRRPPAPLPSTPPSRKGLSYLLNQVGAFVSVARAYELQSAVRYVIPNNGGDTFRESTRRFPIAGEYLFSFAAFLARDFRRFDYASGIYDAIYGLAEEDCTREAAAQVRKTCIVKRVIELHDDLGLGRADATTPDDLAVSYVVRRLLDREITTWSDVDVRPIWKEIAPDGRSIAKWVAAVARPDEAIAAVAEAALAVDNAARQGSTEDPFQTFLGALSDWRAKHRDSAIVWPPAVQEILRDYDGWVRDTLATVVDRVAQQQGEDVHQGLSPDERATSRMVTQIANLGQFAVHAILKPPSFGLRWGPSTIPPVRSAWAGLAHVFPYWVASDFVHGGIEIGYEPLFHCNRVFALALPIVPVSWRRYVTPGPTLPPEAETWARVTPAAYFKVPTLWANSVEFGPTGGMRYTRDGYEVGGEVSLTMLFGRLRISGAITDSRHLNSGTWNSTLGGGLRLGLADVNGTVFWIGRLIGSAAGS